MPFGQNQQRPKTCRAKPNIGKRREQRFKLFIKVQIAIDQEQLEGLKENLSFQTTNEENVVLMILNNVGEEYDDDSVDDDIDDADHPIAVHDSVEQ